MSLTNISPAKQPSTARRSTSSWWMQSAVPGSSPPSSSISICRAASSSNLSAKTARATSRCWCIARFFGVLIEHYAGAFPSWLAPVQASVLPLSEKIAVYAQNVALQLKDAGFRVHLDDRNEKLQAKIRDAQMQKIPYMLVVGGKEAEAGTVAVRHRTKGDLGPRPVAQFIADLRAEVDSKSVS